MNPNNTYVPCIGPRQWKYIYKLLGLVLFADKRIYPEEMDCFIDKAILLGRSIDPSLIVTHRMIKDWGKINRSDLISVIEGLEYDSYLLGVLAHLKPFSHKSDVIRAMIEIGKSGNAYSDRKRLFVHKTMLYWNVKASALEVPLDRDRKKAS